jgi:hypothetical protein
MRRNLPWKPEMRPDGVSLPSGQCYPSVRTFNCNRLAKIAQLYPYQVHVRMIFVVSPFCARKGYLEYSGMLDIVRTCCHVVRTSCINFPNSVDC